MSVTLVAVVDGTMRRRARIRREWRVVTLGGASSRSCKNLSSCARSFRQRKSQLGITSTDVTVVTALAHVRGVLLVSSV